MTHGSSVLIAGAGLTGLSAALFLRQSGVPVTILERHSGILVHPRARTVNPRTLELFRQASLANEILARCNPFGGDLVIQAETLAGPERFRRGGDPAEDISAFSPCPWAPIDQDRLEALLREQAAERGAELLLGTRLASFEQDDHGVRVVAEDVQSGAARILEGAYLIGADGCESTIRRSLGIATQGPGLLGDTVTMVFEADLSGPVRGREFAVCHLDRPLPGTVILPHGPGRWVFSVPGDPSGLDDGDAAEMIRQAVGDSALQPRIVPQLQDGTRFLRYSICAVIADHFRQGRVFLAGDSAHAMPPVGALGSGTGIQDAHNLAWRLAAVQNGQAGARLLDGYEAERRPVAEFTLRQALLQMRDRTRRNVLNTGEMAAPYFAVIFGYRYGDGEPVPPEALTGQVGTRAPHAWIRCGDRTVSTLDLYGDRPALVAGPDGAAWGECARAAAGQLGLPLSVHRYGDDLTDIDNTWSSRHTMPKDGALLVRPDGFVAWRSPNGPVRDRTAVVASALIRLLPGD